MEAEFFFNEYFRNLIACREDSQSIIRQKRQTSRGLLINMLALSEGVQEDRKDRPWSIEKIDLGV